MAETNMRRIYDTGRKDGFFYIDDNISEDNSVSLNIMAGYSRFPIGITKKGDGAVRVNVNPLDVMMITENTNYANRVDQQYRLEHSKEAGTTSIAYTARFMAGTYKGKSPAEVLLENGEEGKKILNDQYLFLKENAGKYKNNRILMDAIREASALLNAGKLDPNAVTTAPSILIDEVDIGFSEKKPREDGRCLVSSYKITWTVGAKSPVNIQINNFWGQIATEEDGRKKVLDRMDERSYTFALTAKEWYRVVSKMNLHLDAFYNTAYAGQKKAVLAQEATDRASRRNNQ